MNSNKGFAILIGALVLVMLLLGIRTCALSNERNDLTKKSEQLEQEVRDFGILKTYLQQKVDSLQLAYDNLSKENSDLQGASSEVHQKLAEKDAIIQKLKSGETNSKAIKKLKLEIEQLLKLKETLETTIADLRTENDSLRAQNKSLSIDLSSARTENEALANLNRSIQEELKKLTLANFKATAFRVEVEKRNPKLTAKAKRAKKILVSFDLTGVKQEHQGMKTLYLVLTDDKGTPVKTSKPVYAKIVVNGQDMDIQAVKEQRTNIVDNQRLTFAHELSQKLKSGYYRVAVYTDGGLLGAASFRLQ